MAPPETSKPSPTRRRVLKTAAAATAAATATLIGAKTFHIMRTHSRRPNFVFIISDALRADHLGLKFPAVDSLTPFVDSLAADGAVFENCLAPSSWTLPSVAGSMTSRHPIITTEFYGESYAHGATTFARELRENGYYTFAVVKNPWLPAMNANRELLPTVVRNGFDYYDVGRVNMKENPLHAKGIGQPREIESFPDAQDATAETIDLLRARSARRDARPFLLYLHYMNTHEPYSPSPQHLSLAADVPAIDGTPDHLIFKLLRARAEKRGENVLAPEDSPLLARAEALYNAAAFSVDDAARRLADYLKASGEFDNTVFIFTSDHGEEFGEHGWFGHSITLYRECLHVPLVFSGPEIPRGARITRLARAVDVGPTICRLAGLPRPAQIEGVALDFAESSKMPPDALACTVAPALPRKLETVTLAIQDHSGKKLITKFPAPGAEGEKKTLLFDLKKDPAEQSPLDAPAEFASALAARLQKHVEIAARRPAGPKITLDPQTEEMLRSIGYF